MATEAMTSHPDLAELRAKYEAAAETATAWAVDGLTFLTALYLAVSPWVVGFHRFATLTAMCAGPSMRILMYSQDGLGLGHLRRTSSLAQELHLSCPGAAVLTVSDSPLGKFFPTGDNHDYLKLPTIRKAGPGEWHPLALPLPFGEVLDLRRDLLRRVALGFQPDVLLVDHMPHGAMGELIPTLEALRGSRTRIVLGLRDILDAPHVIRSRWSIERAYDAVVDYYDEVLVYGSPDVFEVTSEYAWPAAAADRLRYCGYVCAPGGRSAYARRLGNRYRSGVPSTKLIVATAGGGADAYPLFRTLLDAMPAVVAEERCAAVVVTGPFMSLPERAQLRRAARGLPVSIHPSVNNSLDYVAAADLVVSMAGYNTTVEIVESGRPGLLVPRRGPSAEQRIRARLFAERGWVRWLDPDGLSPETLADAVVRGLRDSSSLAPVRRPDLTGRQAAVRRLLTLVTDAERARGAVGLP